VINYYAKTVIDSTKAKISFWIRIKIDQNLIPIVKTTKLEISKGMNILTGTFNSSS
jgi:hypothetical protein